MNPGTLDRLRTETLPGVRGARTLLYDVMLLAPGPVRVGERFVSLAELHRRVIGVEEDLAALIDAARTARNARVAENMNGKRRKTR